MSDIDNRICKDHSVLSVAYHCIECSKAREDEWQKRLDSAISDAARSFKVAMAEYKTRIEAARREGWEAGVRAGVKYMRTCFDKNELMHIEAFIAKGESK